MTDIRGRGEDLAEAQWIAEVLRNWRQDNALTQENLAELCGLSVRAIENYESGRRVPNTQARRSLARGMKVDESLFRAPAPNVVAAWLAGRSGSLAVAVEPVSSAQMVEALFRPPVEMIHIDMSALPDAMMGEGAEIEEAAVDLLNLWE
ncbi:helix-turn-helix domain-containing protein [Thermaurantiacus sp.]